MRSRSTATLVVVTLVLGSCGGSSLSDTSLSDPSLSGTSQAGTPTAPVSSAPGLVVTDASALATFLRVEYGDSDWVQMLDSVVFTEKLGNPVIEVRLDGAFADVSAVADAVLDVFYRADSVDAYVEVWSLTGSVAGANLQSTPRDRAVPAGPADASGVLDWIESAYGSASADPLDEPWLDLARAATYGFEERDNGQRILAVRGLQIGAGEADDPHGYEPVRILLEALQSGGVGFGWADFIAIWTDSPGGMGVLESATSQPRPNRWEY